MFSAASSSCAPVIPLFSTSSSSRSKRRNLGFVACCLGSNGTPRIVIPVSDLSIEKRRCECFDLHQEIVPYVESWSWQQSIVTKRKLLVDSDNDLSDTLIALQHPPVYTLGTDSREDYLHFNVENAPFDVHRIDRGGEVTYHGPGQLVMYPILNLRYHKMDLHWYLRSLEEVIICALSSAFSIEASRVEGLTGVWVGDQKVAAIGIHVSRWITYHGLALNVTTDLTPFQQIVPCGIWDRGVASIKEILGKSSNGREIDDTVLIDMAYQSLIKEFTEAFQLSLNYSPKCHLLESKQLSIRSGDHLAFVHACVSANQPQEMNRASLSVKQRSRIWVRGAMLPLFNAVVNSCDVIAAAIPGELAAFLAVGFVAHTCVLPQMLLPNVKM